MHHFDFDFGCSEDFLKILNEKYKLNLTGEKCRKHKETGWGDNAVCVKYKYNKETKLFEQVNANLTKTGACDTVGCWIFTYDNLDENYVVLGNEALYMYDDPNKELEGKIKNKLEDLNFSFYKGVQFVSKKVKDIILAKSYYGLTKNIFVFDKNLNLKRTLTFKDGAFDFIVIKDKLFIQVMYNGDNKIMVYNLNTWQKIDEFKVEFLTVV